MILALNSRSTCALQKTVFCSRRISYTKSMPPKICVIGAGVIGLSSAVCIQNAFPKSDITVMANTFSPNTTSDGSAGFWLPFLVSPDQVQKVNNWAKITYNHLKDIAFSEQAYQVGVIPVSGYMFSVKNPPWKEYVIGYKTLTEEEMKLFPSKKNGVFFTTMSVDVPKFLYNLISRFQNRGGKVVERTIEDLGELDGMFDVILNCTGIGSRQLVHDESVSPIRGQTVRVKAPWIKHFYFDLEPDGDKYTYILTGADIIVLGGTAQEGDWNTEVDQKDCEGIKERCTALVPSLKNAEIVREWAGLRPSRPVVRIEVDNSKLYKSKVVHNYGHGGAGVTLCWGCAIDATRLVEEEIKSLQHGSNL